MDPTTPPPDHSERGAFVRLVANPELVAAELVERMGPAFCAAVLAALADLLKGLAR